VKPNNTAAAQQRTGATATKQRRSGAAAQRRNCNQTTAQRRSSAQTQGNNSAAAQHNLTTAQRRSSRESASAHVPTGAAQRRSGAKQFKDTHCTHAGMMVKRLCKWLRMQAQRELGRLKEQLENSAFANMCLQVWRVV
jgi:hypothetical protein